jgi:hypothetical protein
MLWNVEGYPEMGRRFADKERGRMILVDKHLSVRGLPSAETLLKTRHGKMVGCNCWSIATHWRSQR